MGKKKETPPRITFPVYIHVDCIIEGMAAFNDDQLFDFIVQVDAMAADYDFTKRLRDFFVSEMNKMDAEEPTIEDRFFMYEVCSGDTLSEIAQRFHTHTGKLVQINRIKNSAHIEPGWILLIPKVK